MTNGDGIVLRAVVGFGLGILVGVLLVGVFMGAVR